MKDDGNVREVIETRHRVLKAIREFFYDRDYLEIETSYLMKSAPSDPYIEPLVVHVGDAGPYYLHTSPEIGMKTALSRGVRKIFQICKVFRVEEFEQHHSVEFTMVEWYRPGTYLDTMGETRELVHAVSDAVGSEAGLEYVRRPWQEHALRDLFVELTGFDPLPLSPAALRAAMEAAGFHGLNSDEPWADLFFRLLVQEVEPVMMERERGPYFIRDWPASLTAMAGRRDEHTAERFELYMKGLEIANGYTELLDPEEQKTRILADNEARRRLGKGVFAPDEHFLQALSRIPGPVSGVSVGVDRLLMALLGREEISDILTDRFTL
jgi:elongation factor P--(R)-beta-lysine ligase